MILLIVKLKILQQSHILNKLSKMLLIFLVRIKKINIETYLELLIISKNS